MKKLFILIAILFTIGLVPVYADDTEANTDNPDGTNNPVEELTCQDFKDLTHDAWFIIRVATPALLIVFGAIDMGKAVMAGEEKEFKKAIDTFIKRIVIALALFLLPLIVDLFVGMLKFDSITACL